MQKELRIGSFKGISIVIQPSWFIIFILITFNLSVGVFPFFHPNWRIPIFWIAGIIASLLFFVSIVIHELAHAFVAQSKGIPVKTISLFIFGGVAHIEEDPRTPQDELQIALAGPFASFAISIAALLLGGFLANDLEGFFNGMELWKISQLSLVSTVLLWLGPVNMLLGLFNLIPGFPLDGGRAFRAMLWILYESKEKAAKISSALSSVVAFSFVATGIAMTVGMHVPFLGTGFLNGGWIALIGWFLKGSSDQELKRN